MKKKSIMKTPNRFQFLSALAGFIVGTFFFGPISGQTQKNNAGIFYSVTGKDSKDTSWLFGTYHLVNSGYLAEQPRVERAFRSSSGVVAEVELDSSVLASVQMMGMMPDKSIMDLTGSLFIDTLDRELKACLGVGLEQLNRLKPANIAMALSITYLMRENAEKLGRYDGIPLDAYFVKEGRRSGKSVTTLETIQEQFDILFNKLTDAEQMKQLEMMLRRKEEINALGNALLDAWFRHDLESLQHIFDQTILLSGEQNYLLRDRNEKWLKILPALLKNGSQFIAVGALHLAGEDGLVSGLRKQGYIVTPVIR
jgi:uncharacterized protein